MARNEGAENLPVQFWTLCHAKAPVKAEGDLGLSGPVVAVYESYWPAKSQVIFSVYCNEHAISTMDKKLVFVEERNENQRIGGWVRCDKVGVSMRHVP